MDGWMDGKAQIHGAAWFFFGWLREPAPGWGWILVWAFLVHTYVLVEVGLGQGQLAQAGLCPTGSIKLQTKTRGELSTAPLGDFLEMRKGQTRGNHLTATMEGFQADFIFFMTSFCLLGADNL